MPHSIIRPCIFVRVKPYELVAALMERAGLGPLPLAKRMGKPKLQPQIHRFMNGEVNEPARTTAAPIAAFFELPIDAMYDEKIATAIAMERGVIGELPRPVARDNAQVTRPAGTASGRSSEAMRNSDDDATARTNHEPARPMRADVPLSQGDVSIPQFDTGGKMGNGLVLRDQPGVIHGWRVSSDWLRQNVRSCSSAQNLCIVTGFGDSMRPMFNPGDPLLVDRGVSTVEYDAIYFFGVDGEGFIKRLQRIPGQGIVAISENQKYKDWKIEPHMDVKVFGRVLKVWRGEEF